MREILFRGFAPIINEFVFGDLIHGVGCKKGITFILPVVKNLAYLKGCSHLDGYEVVPETLGQFTGLIDKDGNKIFEGDIVKYYQPYLEKDETGVVKWDKRWAFFGLFSKDNDWCQESDWVKIQDIEIIGNIHDNPELLEA